MVNYYSSNFTFEDFIEVFNYFEVSHYSKVVYGYKVTV